MVYCTTQEQYRVSYSQEHFHRFKEITISQLQNTSPKLPGHLSNVFARPSSLRVFPNTPPTRSTPLFDDTADNESPVTEEGVLQATAPKLVN